MKTFEFSIIASGLDPASDTFEAGFYDAGCDDATISFQKGHIIADFAREAEDVVSAISSAIANVQATGAIIERIEPDPLVSLSDIAARTGLTRSAVSHYWKGERHDGFPSPSAKITSDSPLWDWSEVADWMFRHEKLSREDAVEAVAVSRANEVIRAGSADVSSELRRQIHDYEAKIAA